MAVNPTYSIRNVLVGVAAMYLQPYDPDTPATLPADSLALDADWSTDQPEWTPIGATDEGLTLNFSRNTNPINIEEQQTAVHMMSETTDVSVAVTLAEDTLQSMLWAMGGGVIEDTAPTTSEPGLSTLTINSDLEQFALGFEGTAPSGFWRRVLLQPVTSQGTIEARWRRAADKRMWATQFNYLNALENMVIREKTEEPTG